MGHGFGHLAYLRGIVYHRISPFEQRAFAGAISHGVPNMFRRIVESVPYSVPQFLLGYLIYQAVEDRHHHLTRKNPADFADDQ